MKPGWKEEELRNWLSSICGPMLLAVLWGFIFRVYMLYIFSDLSIPRLAAFTALFVVCLVQHQITARSSSLLLRTVGCYVYVELMQVFLYLLTLFADQQYSVYYATTSTVFCLTYQITTHTDTWLVVFYVMKQFFGWIVIANYVGSYTVKPFFPYMPFFMMLLLTVKINKYRQNLARERFEFCASLINQERRLQSIMSACPDGVLVLGGDMTIKTWNDALVNLLQIDAGQVRKESILAAVAAMKYDYCNAKTCKLGNESLCEDVLEFIRSLLPPHTFGTTCVGNRYLEWKGSRGLWDEETVCILTVRDSTDWIKMQKKVEHESASKTALLRSVSHELRTPTNAIINLVGEIVEESSLSVRSAEDLSLVSICTHFLLSMINDLLDYSKLIAGQFALVKVIFDIKANIRQCILLFEPQCRSKGIELRVNIDPFLPDMVYSDPNRLKQVLLNLLSNAVKFTMKGFISVMVISISHGRVKITVKDSGIGIEASKQSRLFTLFGKLEGNEVLNPQGSGLGLSIANALACELGGSAIELRSDLGHGAEFTFYVYTREQRLIETPSDSGGTDSFWFDVSEDIHPCVDVPCLLKSEHCFSRQKPLSDILVVDDAEFNRLVMKKILTSLNVPCDEAVNGLQALLQIRKAYHERGHCYRLIVMDLEMPEMDGLTATKEIFRMVETGELPQPPKIVACSAYSSIEDKQMCFSAGVCSYLEKPISKESLRIALSQFL